MRKILFFSIFSLHLICAVAQEVNVKGVVISAEDQLPLPGANVIVKGAVKGTITDMDGQFDLSVPRGATLSVSFIGYKPYEKMVTKDSDLRIVLSMNSTVLDEVVAIGYGSVKKSDLTGAVASIGGDDLKKMPVAGLDKALQGLTPGVTVVSNSGQPGSDVTVRIRGIGTVNDANPIYVVDGVVCDNINFLSPHDIKSTEILKDASSAAIYGARGANGVIIITTKQGTKSEKINLTADVYYGIQNRAKKLDLMNSRQLAEFWGYDSQNDFNEWIYSNFGNSKTYIPKGLDYSSYETDWQDVVFEKNAPIQNYYISADGATDKASYAVSANYFNQEGIIMDSYYKRFTFRVNTSLKVNNWLRIGENLSLMTSSNRDAPTNNSEYSLLNSAVRLAPWDPIRFPNGQISASTIANSANPLSMVEYIHPKSNWDRLVGDAFIEVTFLEGLVFKSDFGLDLSYGRTSTFKDKYEIAPYDKHEQNFIQKGTERYQSWTSDNTLTYTRTFNEKHIFSVMAGMSAWEQIYYSLGGSRENVINPKEENQYICMADGKYTVGDGTYRNAIASFLGRINYSYDNRYFLTFNYRADGSTKFPKNNLWGHFPSFSLAWKISEERFFEKARDVMNVFKLRAGWGQLGNEKIGGDSFYPKVQTGSQFVSYVFGPGEQAIAYGGTMLSFPTQGLKWETTEQWNVGIDYAFFNNRLSGSMDYYIKDTKDMLLSVVLPAHLGNMFASPDNVGKVRNQGFEFTIDYRDRIGRVNYSVGGNLATVKNRFTQMGASSPLYGNGFKGVNLTVSEEGYPLNSFYGYISDGIFQNQDEIDDYVQKDKNGNPILDQDGYPVPILSGLRPGDVRYVDLNGDGQITDLDKSILGSSFPTFTYGFNIALDWNNFDVQLFFQGVAGNKIYNCNRVILEGSEGGKVTNLSVDMLNSWNGEGSTNKLPRVNGKATNYWASDRFLENGSYLRLKNAQIGYTLPKNLTAKIGVEKCRFYVSGSNLFTITPYTGYDPEASFQGVDRGNYPQAITLLFGLTLNL